MSNSIERINTYDDARFDRDILRQHGAFVVDGKYRCGFRIINRDTAVVLADREIDVERLIDEFRFYAEHIVNFYNEDLTLIKSFPPLTIFPLSITHIQPSQFYVDRDKVAAVADFIKSEADIYIPVAKIGGYCVACDGHTRLYYALTQGYSQVGAFFTEAGDYLEGFVDEARRRQVYSPHDLQLLSHEEYQIKWHKFCDDFFIRGRKSE